MSASPHIEITKLTKAQIRNAHVFSGISTDVMRRVFGIWMLFIVVVSLLVFFAPDMSTSFIFSTIGVFAAFTIAMFAQSRISEGWPAILTLQGQIMVVRDPYKREFFAFAPELVTKAESTVIKPNKKAISILLDTEQLNTLDADVLNQAVWPREDRLLALAHFVSREKACEDIEHFVKNA